MTHDAFCSRYLPAGGALLDVGSGRGSFLSAMAKRGFKSFGIETNPDYIARARAYAASQGVSVSIVTGHGESLPFRDARFDFVNCSEVTEHADDPVALCREIYRVLKPGRSAYLSFHNRFGVYDYHYHLWGINWMPRQLAESALRFLGREKADSPLIGRQRLATMHYYRYGEARELLREAGFDTEDIRIGKVIQRFGSFSFLVLAAYCAAFRPFYFNTFHLLATKQV